MSGYTEAVARAVGGPTHAFGLSRPGTRQDAPRQGDVRPGTADVGIREYLDISPMLTGPATAFEVNKPLLPGSAAHKAHRRLRIGQMGLPVDVSHEWDAPVMVPSSGTGCPICSIAQTSAIETALAEAFKALIPATEQDARIARPGADSACRVDGSGCSHHHNWAWLSVGDQR